MPIPLPNLDSRSFAELVADGQRLIPTLHPEWTNHNPSDPGIAVVELLAWLTEMTLYQANQAADGHLEAFLGLLNGPGWAPETSAEGADLITATRDTLLRLRDEQRAVTAGDYERLVTRGWSGHEQVARVRCLTNYTLDPTGQPMQAPGQVTVVVLPHSGVALSEAQRQDLVDYLEPRRQLTVRPTVVAPPLVEVRVRARVQLRPDVLLNAAADQLGASGAGGLLDYFDPHRGGAEGTGWPFGRGVYPSEIYAILGRQPEVDHVESVTVALGDGPATEVGIELGAHQLVAIDLAGVTLVDGVGSTRRLRSRFTPAPTAGAGS